MTVIEKDYNWAYALTPRNVTTHLILHHAAASKASADGIHAYHLSLGWAGIAYHYFVTKEGQILRGRPEKMRGGHTTNWNYCSIGICFEGDFEQEQMSEQQFKAGQELINDIAERYPSIVIGKHSAFGATACPGGNFPFERIIHKNTQEPPDNCAEDKTQPDAWAKDACQWAIEKGVFFGDGNGGYRWHDRVTRQELALILMRLQEGTPKKAV